MNIPAVRTILIGLLAASALTAGGASAANATQTSIVPFFACQPVPQAPLINNICASVANGQVGGNLINASEGTLTVDDIHLVRCNAAQTSCSNMPGSHATTTATPRLPATAGEYYVACVSFRLRFGLLNTRSYGGCSPLVTAYPSASS